MIVDTKEQSALAYWRRQRGLSQTKLGVLLDPPVNRVLVWAWEKGHSQPTPSQMQQISEILDRRITQLFDIV